MMRQETLACAAGAGVSRSPQRKQGKGWLLNEAMKSPCLRCVILIEEREVRMNEKTPCLRCGPLSESLNGDHHGDLHQTPRLPHCVDDIRNVVARRLARLGQEGRFGNSTPR